MAVLRLQPVVVGEGLAKYNIVEHLDDPDAPAPGLAGDEVVHLLVLTVGLLVHLEGEGIVLEPDERGEGVAVPEVERVELALHHHVEVAQPRRLVVEPGEVLPCVGIFVDGMSGQVDGLLQSDARAAHHHLRCFANGVHVQPPLLPYLVGILHGAVDDAPRAAGRDARHALARRHNLVGLAAGRRGGGVQLQHHPVAGALLHLVAQRAQLLLQIPGGIEFLLGGFRFRHHTDRLRS